MRLRKLIKRYRKHPLSRWHKLRYATRKNHLNLLKQIDRRYGRTRLSKISGRTLIEWHTEWIGGPGGTKFSAGRAFIKKIRVLFGFGLTILEDKDCARIRQVMSAMRFPGSPRRKQRITYEQAVEVIRLAHRLGQHSIALAQTFQFELMLRQKDVIGEWVPLEEEGEAYVVDGELKWSRGILWEEIDDDLVLRHRTSKTGKIAVFDLKLAPLVVAELKRFKRRPERGAIVVDKRTELPFEAYQFRRSWRVIARAAKVPDDTFNMDNRAGGISEAFEAQANPDFIRSAATHSELATTQGYNRGGDLERSSAVLKARARKRLRRGPATRRPRRKSNSRGSRGHPAAARSRRSSASKLQQQ